MLETKGIPFRLLGAFMIIGCAWFVMSKIAAPHVIERAYRGESLAFLNRIISGQNHHPVEHYLAKWEQINRHILITLMVIGLVFVIDSLKSHSVVDRHSMTIVRILAICFFIILSIFIYSCLWSAGMEGMYKDSEMRLYLNRSYKDYENSFILYCSHSVFYLIILSVMIFLLLHKNMSKISILFILMLLTFIIRIPFFFDSVMDGDESTFIIMGQDILNGNIPYKSSWDYKPPLLFLYFSILLLFGKSIILIRIGGLLALVWCSYMIYTIGNRIYNEQAGIWGALLVIVFGSTFGSAQSTMSEHVLLIPLSLLLYFTIVQKYSYINIGIIGVLTSLCMLIRSNVIYIIPAIFIIIGFTIKKYKINKIIHYFSILILGIIIPLLFMVLIYYYDNSVNILIRSLITAPLNLFAVKYSSIRIQLELLIKFLWNNMNSTNFFIWIAFILGPIIIYFMERNDKFKYIAINIILCFFITLSIMKMQNSFNHYLIHLIPFMAIIGGIMLSVIFSMKYSYFFFPIILLSLIIPLNFVPYAYSNIINRIYNDESIFLDEGYEIARHLNKNDDSGKYIFICGDYHIAYWLTDAKIPTRFVDPTNLNIEPFLKALDGEGATPENELKNILWKEPVYIVTAGVCSPNTRWMQVLAEHISRDYELEKTIGLDVMIYKRKART